jgi:lysozyme
MMLLDNDIERFTHELRSSLPEFDSLSESRQQVLIDMAFNMGTHGLLGFQRMLSAIKEGDFDNAAEEMLDSRWASQVGDRAKRLARMMREDEAFANVV